MSNLPDNVSPEDIDRAMGGVPSKQAQSDLDELENIHAAYEQAAEALASVFIKRCLMVNRNEFDIIMEQVGEALAHEADNCLRSLEEEGHIDLTYTPAEKDDILEREHERIVDARRPKKIDYSGILFDSMRPVPTNPATLATIDKEKANG